MVPKIYEDALDENCKLKIKIEELMEKNEELSFENKFLKEQILMIYKSK